MRVPFCDGLLCQNGTLFFRKENGMKRFFAFMLAFVMAVSVISVPVFAKSDRLGEFDHSNKKFMDFKYEHLDTTELEAKINDLGGLSSSPENKEKIEVLIGEIEDGLYEIYDMNNYSSYMFTRNNTDTYWKEENLYNTELYNTLATLYLENMKTLCTSPCKEAIYKWYNDDDIQDILDADVPTPEEIECGKKHQMMLAEYYAINPEVEFGGKTYNLESLVEAYYAGEISQFSISFLLNQVLSEIKAAAADIYFRMIENNKKYAEIEDYDNYMDFAFKVGFSRAYTPEDALETCNEIREKLFPYRSLMEAYDNTYVQMTAQESLKNGIIETFGEYIDNFGPEFRESYDYMVKTESCVIIPSQESQTSFTSELKTLGMPFICMTESTDKLWEMETLIHEFGHYNSMYWRDLKESTMSNLDLEETYSQGMEYLFAYYYPELYGDAGKGAELKHLGATLSLLYSGSMIAESEMTAYSGNYKDPSELADALDAIFTKYYPGNESTLYWYIVPHIFQSPGYYFSYVSSALSALEIYENSKENYAEALDKYIELIKNVNEPFETALEKSGFTSKWTSESMAEFLDKLLEIYIDTDAPIIEGVEGGMVYSGSQMVTVKDASGLAISISNEKTRYYPQYRTFAVAGADTPYELSVTDAFGNVSSVVFTIDPYPFTVRAEAGNKKNVLSWDAVEGANYYNIYGAALGKDYKLLGSVDDITFDFTDKVKGTKTYKYYVTACSKDAAGNEVVLKKSYKCYVAGLKNTKKTDAASIEIEGDETISLAPDEKAKITVIRTVKEPDELDITSKTIKGVRYVSTNKNVAKVSKKGKITATGKGKCYIYVISENGITDRVEVKVS